MAISRKTAGWIARDATDRVGDDVKEAVTRRAHAANLSNSQEVMGRDVKGGQLIIVEEAFFRANVETKVENQTGGDVCHRHS